MLNSSLLQENKLAQRARAMRAVEKVRMFMAICV